MYSSMMPVILNGLLNMIFCKSNVMQGLQKPIDFGHKMKDGKRIFGDNKTWKGLIGYIIFGMITSVIWGYINNLCGINQYNYFYINHENTILYNILIGFLFGFVYAICELPNSFMKRRFGIQPGKSINGCMKIFFIFIDQVDSIVGCAFVVWAFYDIGIFVFGLYILFGFVSHLVLNMLLFVLKIRKNMF